jgi:murein DD-endopeptidase MepM/ murein hydrolase activator NlpD
VIDSRSGRPSPLAILVAGACIGAVLAVVPGGIAGAQTDPSDPSGGTSSTTTPGGDPSTSTTSTTIAPTPEDPAANEQIDAEERPEDVEVPLASGADISRAIIGDLDDARAHMADVQGRLDEVVARVARLESRIAELDERLATLEVDQRQAVRQLGIARERFAERAVDAYVRGNNPGLDAILRAEDPSELEANSSFVSTVLDADAVSVQEYLQARAALTVNLVDTADARFEARSDLTRAREDQQLLAQDAEDAEVRLAAFEAGSSIFVSGFVFPVADPHEFISSFGFPRGGGSRQHQGNDIFAPRGTELFATERGVIDNVGSGSLGGIKLWLVGESGTSYYYAHLSAYAEGLHDGMVVEAGDLVGYVGDTGNARGTPPHLHFEIHPSGGSAVDPYPLLSTVDAVDGGLAPGEIDVADA